MLRSDNGGEYTLKDFESYLRKHGIVHQKTAPYTPEQNGVTKCANRTIIKMARTLMSESKVDFEFWGEAVLTAVYLKNRNPTRAVQNMTPEQAWNGRVPTVEHLRPFGCKAYAHVLIQK